MPGAKAARARVMPRVGKTDGASLLTTPQCHLLTTVQEVGQGCLPMTGLESGQAMSGPGDGSETHHSPCHFVEMASQIPTIGGKT